MTELELRQYLSLDLSKNYGLTPHGAILHASDIIYKLKSSGKDPFDRDFREWEIFLRFGAKLES